MKDPTTASHRIIFYRKKYRDEPVTRSRESNTLAGIFPFKDDRARARARYVRGFISHIDNRDLVIECASIDG